jgi:ribosomal-protein-alanine N-acetyltransferase
LTTPRLILRLAEPDDIPALLRFHAANAAHLAPTSPLRPANFLTEQFWREAVAHDRAAFAQGTSARFALFARHDPGTVIGALNLNNIVRGAAHYGDLGFALGAEYEGQGLMSEAARVAIPFAFSDLRLHRIKACYLPSNLRSARLLRRLGFVIEGYARHYLLIQGRWQDQVLTSLIRQDDESLPPPAAQAGGA